MGSPSGSHAPSTICMALLWTLWVRPGTFSFHIFVDRDRDLYGKLLFMGFRVSLPHSILVVSQFYSSSFLYFSLESVGFYFGGPPPCFIVAFCSVLFWQHPRCNLVDSKGFTLAVLFCFGSGCLLGIILVFSPRS